MSFILRQTRTVFRQITGFCAGEAYDFSIELLIASETEYREMKKRLEEAQRIIHNYQQDETTPLVDSQGRDLENLDFEICERFLVGWRDMFNPEGADIPFGVDAKKMFLNQPGMPQRIAQEWALASGELTKNSETLPDSGSPPIIGQDKAA